MNNVMFFKRKVLPTASFMNSFVITLNHLHSNDFIFLPFAFMKIFIFFYVALRLSPNKVTGPRPRAEGRYCLLLSFLRMA